MEMTDRIEKLLEEKYTSDEAFSDCFTVDIELSPSKKLCVFIDSDSGFTFEKCQKISRYLEHILDENGWLGEKYVLEVSSPGIGRPLKFPRQYASNAGRLLSVTVTDQEQPITGKVLSADDKQVILVNTVVEKVEKKKTEVLVETAIPYDKIVKAVIKLDF
jgi:ribosome maturation factor RimP